VHIGFRTSGGRGEYEIVGGASGLPASGLDGWTFHMRWPDGQTRDTGLWLDPAGSGKPRLRSLANPPYQVGRMIAAMSLLPNPRRSRTGLGTDQPVLQENQYIATRIGFANDVSFAPAIEDVEFTPNYIEASNKNYQELIGVEARWTRISAVYKSLPSLDPALAKLLDEHRAALDAGTPINNGLNLLVARLIVRVGMLDPTYTKGGDPLPALEHMIGLVPKEGPALPPPDEIGEDEIDLRAKAAQIYRLAKARGPSARKFSQEVHEAYRNRCVFCGAVYGGIEGVASGVDAAHILAWSAYDLDVVKNGLALCKLHHWAFDAALMVPVNDKGKYFVRFTELAKRLSPDTRAHLGIDGFEIPTDWLPADPSQRPSAKYLRRLYEDLEISF
jgi:hypothetical protein